MSQLKKSFRVHSKIEAFYSGGKVHLTSDGLHLFCPHGDRVNVLNTSTGRVVHSLKQDAGDEVTCISLSPDDEVLVVAYRNLLLTHWSWKEETCTRTWKAIHIAPIICMTFETTSTLLATGSSDSTIKVWDISQQYCTHNLKGSQGVVNIVYFRPQSEQLELFSASADNVIRVWDLKNSKCKHQLAKHYGTVTSLAFSQKNKTMLSAGRDSVVIVWDLQAYTSLRTIPVFEPLESVMCLREDVVFPYLKIDQEGQYFITAGAQGELKVWDASNGRHIFTQQESPMKTEANPGSNQNVTNQVMQATFVISLDVILVVTFEHNILFFDVQNFNQQKQFVGNNEEILDVRYIGADQSHLAVVTNSPLIRVFELTSLDCQLLSGHTDIILSLAVFKKGLLMASGSKDNSVRLWQMDPDTGSIQCVAVAKGHTHSVLSLCTPRLSSLWLVSGGEDCTIKFWNIPSEFEADQASKLPQLTIKYTERAHEKSVNSLAVSPNDKLLATGSQDKTVKLYNVENQEHVGTLRGHKRGIWCVQFSPTDQALATSSADGTIKIWSLTDFSCVKTFEGHDASVLKLMFLSKGMQILSSGSDGLLKLWTIKNNECITTLDEHSEKVWGLDHNKSQSEFVSGGADGAIIIWHDVTQVEQQEEIEKQEQQILKEQQLSNYLQEKKFLKALRLAITLDQPFNVLKILRTILDVEDGHTQLIATLKKLRQDQIVSILGFIRVWNTNAKHCHVAQTVLSIIMQQFSVADLMTYPNMKEALEGLIPYTDRHLQRMNRLSQQATFVEFIWQSMRRAPDSQDELIPPSVLGMDKIESEEFPVSGDLSPDNLKGSLAPSIEYSSDNSSDADEKDVNYEQLSHIAEVEKTRKDEKDDSEKSEKKAVYEQIKQFRMADNRTRDLGKHKKNGKGDWWRKEEKKATDFQESDYIEENMKEEKAGHQGLRIEDKEVEMMGVDDNHEQREYNLPSASMKKTKRRRSGRDIVMSIQKKRMSLGLKNEYQNSEKVQR